MAKAAVVASLLSAAHAARVARTKSTEEALHMIAGVPVLNYHLAPKRLGVASNGEEKIPWVVVAQAGKHDDASLEKACKTAGTCEKVGHPQKGGMPYFVVHATESELQDVLGGSAGSYSFIEPDADVQAIPDVEVQTAANVWGLTRIGAGSRASQGKGAHVYVLDTGVRTTHTDFGGRASSAIDVSSGSVTECGGSATCARDGHGHGTHCAGTVAGTTYGVAPQAKIHAGKVLSDSGSGSFSWSYDALDWVASKAERPAAVSMSLGGQGVMAAQKVAVDTAVDAGVTVVVAGGNSNSDACGFSPAYIPSAITVGSTTSNDKRSYFSNYGTCTNIWAPGSDIKSLSYKSDTGTATMSGTSMACPHVSGGAALLLGENPSLSPAAVLEQLLDNAIRGAISDLKSGDTNALLWVGAAPGGSTTQAPTEPPKECPNWCLFCLLDACKGCC